MKFETFIENAPLIVRRKLVQLKFLRERPDFHPEPSTFEHIKIVTERLKTTRDINLVFSGILHDICKLDTVQVNEKTGWPTSPGHATAAFELIKDTASIKDWIFNNGGNWLTVANICNGHMRIQQLDGMKEAKRLKTIQEWKEQEIWESLQIFTEADNMLQEFNLENVMLNLKK